MPEATQAGFTRSSSAREDRDLRRATEREPERGGRRGDPVRLGHRLGDANGSPGVAVEGPPVGAGPARAGNAGGVARPGPRERPLAMLQWATTAAGRSVVAAQAAVPSRMGIGPANAAQGSPRWAVPIPGLPEPVPSGPGDASPPPKVPSPPPRRTTVSDGNLFDKRQPDRLCRDGGRLAAWGGRGWSASRVSRRFGGHADPCRRRDGRPRHPGRRSRLGARGRGRRRHGRPRREAPIRPDRRGAPMLRARDVPSSAPTADVASPRRARPSAHRRRTRSPRPPIRCGRLAAMVRFPPAAIRSRRRRPDGGGGPLRALPARPRRGRSPGRPRGPVRRRAGPMRDADEAPPGQLHPTSREDPRCPSSP